MKLSLDSFDVIYAKFQQVSQTRRIMIARPKKLERSWPRRFYSAFQIPGDLIAAFLKRNLEIEKNLNDEIPNLERLLLKWF